ncbi:hypothetical protein GTW51_10155 [Aurantimonas aggregata]|uniref:Uncharacterized protein n=1 Tax=Aurantimonas aggregata TaxID=2047720 RepID=A0A6L9MGW0_9HYPH|nr:hypothetical protein [Aurantimonas aggregata]NDV87064.1 hypothetical protein [Aurantimonas aggregata]
MKIDLHGIRAAAVVHRAKTIDQVASLRAAEASDVSGSKTMGLPLGDKHWHPRYRAELRLRASEALISALDEVLT